MDGQPDQAPDVSGGADAPEALDVLRSLWSARGQSGADLEQAFGPAKSCKNMSGVGFDGLAGDDADLRASWRAQLQREGKLNPASTSVADLVLRPADGR